MRRTTVVPVLGLLGALAWCSAARAQADAKNTFVDHVGPILRQHCVSCHNKDKSEADFVLDSYEALMDSGYVEAGDLDGSYVWTLIDHQDDPKMPPKQDKLPQEKLDAIKKWILDGAIEQRTEPKVTYAEHVQPIFRQRCFACHNQNQARSDLALDTYVRAMQGGAGGNVLEPGDPDGSRLYLLVTHQEEPKMPKEQDKLPEAELALIRKWIEGGALKDPSSKVVVKPKPNVQLAVSAGAGRPEGEPALPQGLSLEPVVVTGRPGAVTALASSPWAPVLAVGGQKQIVLWHTDSGALLGILPFPEGIPHVLRFSRAGTLLLAGGGHAAQKGMAVVYDVKTGKRITSVGDELDAVLAADILEDHSLIALAGPGRIVRTYATADGTLQHELKKHTDWVRALQFSPDGVLLATGDRAAGLVVWESHTGREYQVLTGHKGAINDVSWRADSNLLASGSEDGTVKLWEMNEGKMVKSWAAHGGGVTAVAFTHDGRLVSAGRDKQVKIWDAEGKQLQTIGPTGDLPLKAAFSHDGKRVVAGDWSGAVHIWEASDGKEVAAMSANPPKPVD